MILITVVVELDVGVAAVWKNRTLKCLAVVIVLEESYFRRATVNDVLLFF